MDYEIDAELESPDVGEGDFWREAFRWADEGALVPDGSLAPSDSFPEVPGPLQALQGLNADQRAAAEHVFGPAKVTAGAGAGKTKTLVARVVNLTWNHDVDPAQICLITFTCRAAGEIRARVAASVGARANAMAAGTFHSVALAIIRDDVRRFGRKGNPSIWDEDTTARELRRICEAVTGHSKGGGAGQKQWTPETLMAKLSAHKEAAKPWPSPEFEAGLVSEHDAQALEVLLEYESAKQVSNAFDYDDLIHKVVRMAEEDEEFGEKLAARWDFVMVDEYQDTNALQDRFIGLLAKRSRNLMIVGDDDQCLVAGTQIAMADGTTRSIEDVKVGDRVFSSGGASEIKGGGLVSRVFVSSASEVVRIEVEGGQVLFSTPEHTHFASFVSGVTPQRFFTYLMFRRDLGYRVGTTRVYTAGQVAPVLGFKQRALAEHADSVWIIGVFDTEHEARIDEHVTSLRYQISTLAFVRRDSSSGVLNPGGISHDASLIFEVFSAVRDISDAGAARLLHDRGLTIAAPHHRSMSRNSSHRHVRITLCGGSSRTWAGHRISMTGNDASGASRLRQAGLNVRASKADCCSWRYESVFSKYSDAMLVIERIRKAFELENVEIIQVARLHGEISDNSSLPFIPAGSVLPGMVMFDSRGKHVLVKSVSRVPYDGNVYDIDVLPAHNFSANGILTHNSIYGWRGSDVTFILGFESRWEGCRSYHLGQNYRSTPEVVAVADGIVSRSKQRQTKRIWTENPSGLPVMLMKAKNHEDEAFQIGAQICARISAGAKARDCAVLVRTRHQLLVLEKHLTGLGLRSQVVGLTAWWRREDSKHVLSWLKILSNPLDINAAHSVLAHSAGVGPKTVSDWRDLARVTQGELLSVPLKAMMQTKEYRVGLKRGEAISAVVERHGRYQKLLQDGALMLDLVAQIYADSGIDALLQSMRSNEDAKKVDEGAAREDFRERMLEFSMEISDLGYEGALVFLDTIYTQSADTEVGPSGRVLLTTIHSAKGLEWEHVWIAGFVQGLLPHGRIDDYGNVDVEFSNLEEERRLAYVAVTRARSTLMLSRVERTLSANKVPVPAFKSTFWLDAEEVFEAAKGPKPKSALICLSQVSRRQAPRKAPQQEEIKPASSLCLRDILQRRRR